MKKGIKNADAIACKLGPVLIKVTNDRLEVAREEKRKREEMMEKRKVEAMATKRRKAEEV